MVNLESVTLIAMTSVGVEPTIKALEYSCKDIKFGAVKLVSDTQPENLPTNITYEYTEKISNIDEWNHSTPRYISCQHHYY